MTFAELVEAFFELEARLSKTDPLNIDDTYSDIEQYEMSDLVVNQGVYKEFIEELQLLLRRYGKHSFMHFTQMSVISVSAMDKRLDFYPISGWGDMFYKAIEAKRN